MYLASIAPQNILSVVQPLEECCYCWYLLHPDLPYPEDWSSTICTNHENWILTQLAARRASQGEKARVQA